MRSINVEKVDNMTFFFVDVKQQNEFSIEQSTKNIEVNN